MEWGKRFDDYIDITMVHYNCILFHPHDIGAHSNISLVTTFKDLPLLNIFFNFICNLNYYKTSKEPYASQGVNKINTSLARKQLLYFNYNYGRKCVTFIQEILEAFKKNSLALLFTTNKYGANINKTPSRLTIY